MPFNLVKNKGHFLGKKVAFSRKSCNMLKQADTKKEKLELIPDFTLRISFFIKDEERPFLLL